MKKVVTAAYLVVVHALLGVALVKTDLVPRITAKLSFGSPQPQHSEDDYIILRLREVHRQMDSAVPAGATIFIGDSITMALATAAVAPRSVNYGISAQRSDQLIKSMDIYKSIERASRVIVTIGTNDLLQGREAGIELRYKEILAKIPISVEVVISSVPPLGKGSFYGRTIEDINVRKVVASAKSVCEADSRCRFVNAYDVLTTNGTPIPGTLLADNIHLSPEGYRLWIYAINNLLVTH